MSDHESTFTSGPTPIGRAGEDRVVRIVTELLTAKGYSISPRPSNDAQGEDARLTIDSATYTVQATTVPGASDFWQQAAQGSATTTVSAQQAATWLSQAIEKKVEVTPPSQRAQTIIVLDAHDWGDRLAGQVIVQQLQDVALNPAQRYGLAGIAIAGRTASDSTWLAGEVR